MYNFSPWEILTVSVYKKIGKRGLHMSDKEFIKYLVVSETMEIWASNLSENERNELGL